MAGSVAAVAEDLLSAARANRGLLLDVVRSEVERAAAGLGFAPAAEVTELRRRVNELEKQVESLQAADATSKVAGRKAAAKKSAAKKSAEKKSAAKKASPRKSATTAKTAKTTSTDTA
jgi:cell division septum initiation protein DivIVA